MNDSDFSVAPPSFPPLVVEAGKCASIQEAVDACARQGGGTVLVPPGIHRTGPVHLRSNIRLHLEEGAALSFDDNPEAYLPVVFTRWEGTECWNYSPLVYACGCENVAITGTGRLLGNGARWWPWKTQYKRNAQFPADAAADGTPVEKRIYGTVEAGLRPSFVQFIRCRKVLWQDFQIEDGPMWTLHPVYCEDVTVRGVTVRTTGPNTDGLNPDSCRNVLVEDCRFSTGDDCIAVNAGLNEDGWRVGIPCENILVRRCTMRGGHGGVTIGSAVSGGVRNVLFEDCDIRETAMGIRMKSMRGRGGVVEHVAFRRIRLACQFAAAIQITMFYSASTCIPRQRTPSVFRDIVAEDITGDQAAIGIEVRGLPEQHLERLRLGNVRLTAVSSMEVSDVDNLEMDGVSIAPCTPPPPMPED